MMNCFLEWRNIGNTRFNVNINILLFNCLLYLTAFGITSTANRAKHGKAKRMNNRVVEGFSPKPPDSESHHTPCVCKDAEN